MKTRIAFAKSLREARKALGLTQEDFSLLSSRTYDSSLERGIKSPTLDKIEDLAKVLKIHPLTLITLTYLKAGKEHGLEGLFQKVRAEIEMVQKGRK